MTDIFLFTNSLLINWKQRLLQTSDKNGDKAGATNFYKWRAVRILVKNIQIMGSFTQRYVKRHGLRPPVMPDSGVPGYDPAGNIDRKPSSRF